MVRISMPPLLHRSGLYLSEHLVSVHNRPTGFIVLLYSSKSPNHHSYRENDRREEKKDKGQEKVPGSDTSPACENLSEPVPHRRPPPVETPTACKGERKEQNGPGSALRGRPNGRNTSESADEDPCSHETMLGMGNLFT